MNYQDKLRNYYCGDENDVEVSTETAACLDVAGGGVDFQVKCKLIREDIIGSYSKFEGPYGVKPVCYLDWTASGRSLASIERFIVEDIMPLYGNTHTVASRTGII